MWHGVTLRAPPVSQGRPQGPHSQPAPANAQLTGTRPAAHKCWGARGPHTPREGAPMGVDIMEEGQRGDKQFQVSKPDKRIPGLQHSGTKPLLCMCQGLGTMPWLTQAPRVRPATHTPTTHGHLAEQHHLAWSNKLTSCGGRGEGDMQGGNRPHRQWGWHPNPQELLTSPGRRGWPGWCQGPPGDVATVGWSALTTQLFPQSQPGPQPVHHRCTSSQPDTALAPNLRQTLGPELIFLTHLKTKS